MKDKTTKIKTNTEGHHKLFPTSPATEDVPVHTSASLCHVHKQKYIHSSHFGTVFSVSFIHKKLQKAPKSTIESACGDRTCGL